MFLILKKKKERFDFCNGIFIRKFKIFVNSFPQSRLKRNGFKFLSTSEEDLFLRK